MALRDVTPFSQPFLGFWPAAPPPLDERTWGVEVRFSIANTFVASPVARAYLADRSRRRPLSTAEMAAIAGESGDDFFFDGEVASLGVEARWRVGRQAEVYLTVPALLLSGGVLDTVIEEFHDAFGFDQAGRDHVARDRFQLLLEVGGESLALAEPPTRGGIGDPVVGGRWRLGAQAGWTAVAEAAVKLPVDGERFLLSTGGVDAGVQLVAQRRSPVWGASVAASVVRTAASRGVLRLPEQTLPSVTTALARRAGSATEAVAQLT